MVEVADDSPGADGAGDLLTLDQVCERVGMSVRNVRFYTTRGLVPPPLRRGRSGYYTAQHVVRLELVKELQAHGFTLAAIEKYVARIPERATPDEIALHSTLLAPWQPLEAGEVMNLAQLVERAGRDLDESNLKTLELMRVITSAGRGRWQVSTAYLSLAVGLLDVGFPEGVAAEVESIYSKHAREVAEEITEVFRKRLWPSYRAKGLTPEQVGDLVQRLQPLSCAGLVQAYGEAINETKREVVERRAGRQD